MIFRDTRRLFNHCIPLAHQMSFSTGIHVKNIHLRYRRKQYSFLLPTEIKEEEGEQKSSSLVVAHIKDYNFASVNEVKVSQLLKSIPNGSLRYHIVDSYEVVTMKGKKCLLVKYLDVSSKPLLSFLSSSARDILEMYTRLCKSIQLLGEQGICHHRLSFENIHILPQYGDKPMLLGLEQAIRIDRMRLKENEEYLYAKKVLQEGKDVPFEEFAATALLLLSSSSSQALSLSTIESLCDDYLPTMEADNNRLTRRQQCRELLSPFINKPLSCVIEYLLDPKHILTWDYYRLASLFLQWTAGRTDIPKRTRDTWVQMLSLSPKERWLFVFKLSP